MLRHELYRANLPSEISDNSVQILGQIRIIAYLKRAEGLRFPAFYAAAVDGKQLARSIVDGAKAKVYAIEA